MSKENIERGLALRLSLLDATTSAGLDDKLSAGEGMRRFGEYVYDAVLGNLWLRDGLDIKVRTLVCVITDVAMGLNEELEVHIKMALNQGWTETELIEVILHAGGYCGIPRGRQAMLVADKVFGAYRAAGV